MTGRPAFHPYALAKRANAGFAFLTVVFGLLALSFFRLQIVQHAQYELKSESNRLRPLALPAPRGLIVDRRGQVIAENVPGYSVSLLAPRADTLAAMLQRMAGLLPLDSEQVHRVMQRFRAAPYEPALVIKDAPPALVARLEERRALLPGLVIQTEPKRHYPDSSVVAHLVGYVGEVTEQELAGPFSHRRLGAMVGKSGLEREYEDSLHGGDGVRFVEVDALGRVVREEGASALPPEPGATLHTTIDMDLQRFVASIYPHQYRGAIVAMEPQTGAILALYSNPSYDPNMFVGGISRTDWQGLTSDPALPLLNRAISTRYPPASTFKLATAVMALRRGVAQFDTRMPQPCRGGLQIGNRFFRCWKPEGHGSQTLVGAIATSCDVYFYQLGMRLGVAAVVDDANTMGFRGTSGVDLPGEVMSVFPAGTDYYDRLYGSGRWTNAVAVNLAIGQGENDQTLINMVRFYAALANGGHVPTPHVVMARRAPPPPIDLSDSLFLVVRQALVAVVEQGTGRGVRLAELQLAGKTGTAQNPHGLDHGWFIGFAPADHPAIVVGGIFEFGQHGTTVAPYVARTIERYLLGPDSVRSGAFEPVPLDIPDDSAPRSVAIDSPVVVRRAPRRPAAAPTPAERVIPVPPAQPR